MMRAQWPACLSILFALLVSACSSMPQSSNATAVNTFDEGGRVPANGQSLRSTNVLLAPLGTVAIGQVATLSAENPLGVTRVRVIDEYAAASGRLCRRITIAERQPRLRLVCREPGADWSLVRGLVPASQ